MKTILRDKDIEMLKSYDHGFYHKMLEYLRLLIDNGIRENRFTIKEVKRDLQLSLWIAYACNNIDQYETYFMACQWLSCTEDLAHGYGVWYYRYSCALMYCGKLTEALYYAEQGVLEEPTYPWGWLQLAKLRSHFGDLPGALLANETGLALVPGDYEFMRQEKELRQGASLEQMLNHYIYEDDDLALLSKKRTESEKIDVISGVVCNQENLNAIKALLCAEEWTADCPYCSFHMPYQEKKVLGVFEMNEAAISKLSLDWLKETLDTLPQLVKLQKANPEDILKKIIFHRDRSLSMNFQSSKDILSSAGNGKSNPPLYS